MFLLLSYGVLKWTFVSGASIGTQYPPIATILHNFNAASNLVYITNQQPKTNNLQKLIYSKVRCAPQNYTQHIMH